jgi:peptidoglycan hydrolase-like protein with peptidoglycan-binding domain
MMYGHSHSAPQLRQIHVVVSGFIGLCAIGIIQSESVFAQATKPPTKSSSAPSPTQSIPKPVLKAGSQGDAVTELQAMLKLMSFYTGPINGLFDESTTAAVAKFQKAANLSADGIVGAETWNRLLPPSPTISSAPRSTASATKPGAAESFPLPGNPKSSATPPAKTASTPPPKPTASTGSPAGSDRSQATQEATFPVLRLGMKGPAVEGLQERLRALGLLKGSVDGVFGSETQAAVRAAQRRLSLEPDGVVGNATWIGILR